MALSDLLKDLDPKYASALSQISDILRQEFDQKLASTREELGLGGTVETAAEAKVEEVPAVAPVAVADHLDPIEELKHAVTAIDAAASQGEILDSLVSGCARFASRCAIFLVRDGRVTGWTSHGFSLSDDEMRAISFSVEPGSPWESLGEDEGTLALDSEQCSPLCARLNGKTPEMGVLVPFVLNNQTAAGIYCDRLEGDGPPNVAALQLVTFVASQVLENLPVRDRASTSTLRLAAATAATATTAAAEQETRVETPSEPETELDSPSELETYGDNPSEIEMPADTPSGPEARIEPPALEDEGPDALFEPEENTGFSGPQASAGGFPATATQLYEPELVAQPVPAATPADDESEAPTILSDTTTQVLPPSDLEGPGWAFTGAGASTADTGDESQHEEARRLARLLVTEVKLYNEELVEQGRKKGDVYSVLKEDIDRSRQIFEDRIAEDVRSHSDYFREALVRILAGGDPSVLGD